MDPMSMFSDEEERNEYVIALVVLGLFGLIAYHFMFRGQDMALVGQPSGDQKVVMASLDGEHSPVTISTKNSLSTTSPTLSSALPVVTTPVLPESVPTMAGTLEGSIPEVTNTRVITEVIKPEIINTNISIPEIQVAEVEVVDVVSVPSDTEIETIDAVVETPRLENEESLAAVIPTQEVVTESPITDTVSESDVQEVQASGVEIRFEEGSTTLTIGSTAVITNVVRILNKYPEVKLRIAGHTDNVGDADYNLQLSADRANACADIIVESGIERSRLRVESFGETRPIADNDTAEGNEKNRRVELSLEL